mmetsp:Transcript_80928/g.187977  ORF Transcript_80928/g.187977 Transcript_80928/m.187977 type:complete len:180 (+) Transcript_80928:163-702(+)
MGMCQCIPGQHAGTYSGNSRRRRTGRKSTASAESDKRRAVEERGVPGSTTSGLGKLPVPFIVGSSALDLLLALPKQTRSPLMPVLGGTVQVLSAVAPASAVEIPVAAAPTGIIAELFALPLTDGGCLGAGGRMPSAGASRLPVLARRLTTAGVGAQEAATSAVLGTECLTTLQADFGDA